MHVSIIVNCGAIPNTKIKINKDFVKHDRIDFRNINNFNSYVCLSNVRSLRGHIIKRIESSI